MICPQAKNDEIKIRRFIHCHVLCCEVGGDRITRQTRICGSTKLHHHSVFLCFVALCIFFETKSVITTHSVGTLRTPVCDLLYTLLYIKVSTSN